MEMLLDTARPAARSRRAAGPPLSGRGPEAECGAAGSDASPSRRAALAAAPAAAQVVRIYEVQYRSAEELLPLAETALAGEGRVSADRRTNSLVLAGSGDAVAERARAVGVARRAAAQRRAALRVAARERSRGARSPGDVARRGALRVGSVVWPQAAAALRVDDTREERTSSLAGQLRIMDGQTGRIATGASAPVTTRRVRDGRGGPVIVESTGYVTADSGFEARPRVLRDGRIELALRPFDASLRADGVVASSGAATTLLLAARQDRGDRRHPARRQRAEQRCSLGRRPRGRLGRDAAPDHRRGGVGREDPAEREKPAIRRGARPPPDARPGRRRARAARRCRPPRRGGYRRPARANESSTHLRNGPLPVGGGAACMMSP